MCVQCIHNMSMWTSGNKELSYDQAKEDAKKAQKDVRLVSQCATLTLLALKLLCTAAPDRSFYSFFFSAVCSNQGFFGL